LVRGGKKNDKGKKEGREEKMGRWKMVMQGETKLSTNLGRDYLISLCSGVICNCYFH